MNQYIRNFDSSLINTFQKIKMPLARIAIFIVYFWFGAVKLTGMSPAGPLVHALYDATIPFVPFSIFYVMFAVFEMVIGVLFLIRGWERVALIFIALHLVTTGLPLIFLPHFTWQAFFVPTIEGQYIIKNILIIAVAVLIGSKLNPLRAKAI